METGEGRVAAGEQTDWSGCFNPAGICWWGVARVAQLGCTPGCSREGSEGAPSLMIFGA